MDNNFLQAATANFNLPHDVVQLPTGGIFYKSKKKAIKVGYLTANDENFLINAASNGNANVVLQLLRTKIYEPDVKPEELIDSDVEAILIFLRNTSFGPEYTINLIDPKTSKQFSDTITLDELNLKKVQTSPDEDGTYTTKLPKTESVVKLRPLTYSDQIELEKMADSYPTNLTPPRITWRLNKQIVDVDGNNDKAFISKFVEQLPIADSKYIRNFLKENLPSLDLKKTTTAPSGELVNFEITFGVEFFRPFF
jgi:hypothetical protein